MRLPQHLNNLPFAVVFGQVHVVDAPRRRQLDTGGLVEQVEHLDLLRRVITDTTTSEKILFSPVPLVDPTEFVVQ